MKVKILLISILLLIVAVAVVILSLQSAPVEDDQVEQTAAEQNSKSVSEPKNGVGTLAGLANSSEPIECSISYRPNELDKQIQGTFFARNGNVRADFVQEDTSLGQVVTSYVSKNGELYVWSQIDGETYGVKTTESVEADSLVSLPVPRNESARYNCSEWILIDDSVFEIPSAVLFKDAAQAEIEYGTIYEEGEFGF